MFGVRTQRRRIAPDLGTGKAPRHRARLREGAEPEKCPRRSLCCPWKCPGMPGWCLWSSWRSGFPGEPHIPPLRLHIHPPGSGFSKSSFLKLGAPGMCPAPHSRDRSPAAVPSGVIPVDGIPGSPLAPRGCSRIPALPRGQTRSGIRLVPTSRGSLESWIPSR